MTNEEAIEILKGAIKKPNTQDGYLGQALTMGIEALEKEIGCPYCKYNDVDGRFDSLYMNCHSNDMWVRKENKE